MQWGADLLRHEQPRLVVGLSAVASCTAVYMASTLAVPEVAPPRAHRDLRTAPFPKPYPRHQRQCVDASPELGLAELQPKPETIVESEPDQREGRQSDARVASAELDTSQHIAELEARVAELATTMENSIAKLSSTQRKLELQSNGDFTAKDATVSGANEVQASTSADDPPDAPVASSWMRGNPGPMIVISDSDDDSCNSGCARNAHASLAECPQKPTGVAPPMPTTSPGRADTCSDTQFSASPSSSAEDSGDDKAASNFVRDRAAPNSKDASDLILNSRARMLSSSDSDSDSDDDDDVITRPPRARYYATATAPARTAPLVGTPTFTTTVDSASDGTVKLASYESSDSSDSDSSSRMRSTFGSQLRMTEAHAERAKKRLEARRGRSRRSSSIFAKGQRRRNFASGSLTIPKKPNRFDKKTE